MGALEIFLIVLVLGMVLTPVVHIMPNKRQKRIGALRQQAHQEGWQVKWVAKPDLQRQQTLDDKPKAANAFVYRLPRPQAEQIKTALPNFSFGRSQASENDWFCFYGKRPPALLLEQIIAKLQDLPPTVDVVESNAAGLGVFWSESEIDALQPIKAILLEIDQIERAFWQKNCDAIVQPS